MGTKLLPTTDQESPWESTYRPWRHGGWYTDARYPNGASGCVSNNYDDKKWRIACSHFGLTFSTRRDAANAERAMTLAMHAAEKEKADLLAACKAADKAMRAVFGNGPIAGRGTLSSEYESLRQAAVATRAAIARAEGQDGDA